MQGKIVSACSGFSWQEGRRDTLGVSRLLRPLSPCVLSSRTWILTTKKFPRLAEERNEIGIHEGDIGEEDYFEYSMYYYATDNIL